MPLSRYAGIEFDCIVHEGLEFENRITTKPTEAGVEIADHVHLQPLLVKLTGKIVGDGAQEKYRRLVQIRNERGAHTLQIGLGVYTGLVIELLSPLKTARNADGFEFDLMLREIATTEPREALVRLPDPVSGQVPTGDPLDRGTQQVEEDAVVVEDGSVLYRILHGAGVID